MRSLRAEWGVAQLARQAVPLERHGVVAGIGCCAMLQPKGLPLQREKPSARPGEWHRCLAVCNSWLATLPQGALYRSKAAGQGGQGGVGLVLGAGNQLPVAALDILHKLASPLRMHVLGTPARSLSMCSNGSCCAPTSLMCLLEAGDMQDLGPIAPLRLSTGTYL